MLKKIIYTVLILTAIVFSLKSYQSFGDKTLQNTTITSKSTIISSSPLSVETLNGKSGTGYTFIYKNSAQIGFEIFRPSIKDTNIYLCIAGAFTTLDNYKIDGLYICNGKAGNKTKINNSLGGAIKIVNGECEIFPTERGILLTDSLIATIEKKSGSLFQQIQCITNGVPAKFKDVKNFQRRGIVIMKNGKVAIAESNKMITLETFSNDLSELGVKDLLYTDMGYWDEGWYRTSSNEKIVKIGHYLSQTEKQSNWVVFRK